MKDYFLKVIESKAGFPQSQLLREKLASDLADRVKAFDLWKSSAIFMRIQN